jgi:hypothetical protein
MRNRFCRWLVSVVEEEVKKAGMAKEAKKYYLPLFAIPAFFASLLPPSRSHLIYCPPNRSATPVETRGCISPRRALARLSIGYTGLLTIAMTGIAKRQDVIFPVRLMA